MKKIPSEERIGRINKNNYGSLMEVIEYNGSNYVLVRFETGNLAHTTWFDFKNGSVNNVYDKNVYGVGYMGKGDYKTMENGKESRKYITWHGILGRCYSKKFQQKQPSYIGCTVTDEWHNFQNFAEWYDKNYYEIDNEVIHIDKDILVKGNKIYSPETCVFVPSKINTLFVKSNAKRGKYPIGVRASSTPNKYIAQCLDGYKKQIYLGTFNTPEEAFNTYKSFKEKLIKQFAEKYRDKIPDKLYDAMMKYTVEITD